MDTQSAVPVLTPTGRLAPVWPDQHHEKTAPPEERSAYLERFLIPTSQGLEVVACYDVDWFEARGNYIRLHVGSVTYDLRKTMRALAQRLDPQQFHRIHRCTIVNLVRIGQIRVRASGDCIVVLRDGQELRMSRAHRRELLAAIR